MRCREEENTRKSRGGRRGEKREKRRRGREVGGEKWVYTNEKKLEKESEKDRKVDSGKKRRIE